ncbi:TPA: hypothetical protein ACIJPQ_005117, partial [Klebsiella pneumoniae]
MAQGTESLGCHFALSRNRPLAAQGGFSAEKEPVVTEHMYAGHKVQQENSQSRIQIVSSMHEGAWITLEGNVVSQQQ